MNQLHPIGAAVTVLAFAATAQAQNMPSPRHKNPENTARATFSSQDVAFIKNAAVAGKAEVQASRLALQKAVEPDVRSFARRMVDDHSKANAKLEQLARERGVRIPVDYSVSRQSRINILKSASGREFDKEYERHFGVSAHEKAIELFRKEAEQGQDPQLKAFARKTLDTLQQHLQLARKMESGLDAQVMGSRRSGVGSMNSNRSDTRARNSNEELQDAQQEITESVQVVQRMKADPHMAAMLKRARGVFILPNYGRAALGIGVQGGEGVLVTRKADSFSDPVFYNLGGASIGAQAGAAGGQLALLLMTDRAVREFTSGKNFSLNADAGLAIANYSARGQVSGGKVQDILIWSDTEGAYAGVSVAITDVAVDNDANRAYYGRADVSPAQIVSGAVPSPHNNILGIVLNV